MTRTADAIRARCTTLREVKEDRKAYIENERICPTIRKRRYPIHDSNA